MKDTIPDVLYLVLEANFPGNIGFSLGGPFKFF